MDFFDLIYVKRIAELGSISKAANALFIAQPNLSRKIKALEQTLNIKLFIRSNTGVVLTEKGKEFLAASESIINQCQRFENTYLQKKNTIELSIISARSSYVCSAIISFINSNLKLGKRVEIKFEEAINQNVITGLYYKAYDLGIVRPTTFSYNSYVELIKSYGLSYIELPRLDFVILMHEDHPLANEHELFLSYLFNYTEVAYYDFENYTVSVRELATGSDVKLPSIIRVADRGSLLDTVSQVSGAFMITTGTNKDVLRKYNLVEIPCQDLELLSHDMIIYKDGEVKTPYLQQFIDCIFNSFPLSFD